MLTRQAIAALPPRSRFDLGLMPQTPETTDPRNGILRIPCLWHNLPRKDNTMDFIAPDHELTEDIIRCAVEVHRVIGPGLKEEVYEDALEWELVHAGHQVARQVACPVTYKGVRLETKREDKKIDMLVDGRVVLELKATPVMEPVFKAQCFTYVKMLGLSSGLVLNFGRVTLKEGIARVINESKADYRTRLLREDPRAFRNLLVEEDGITLEEANRMQLAGDIGLHAEGSGRCRGHLSGETETGDRS